MPHQKTKKDMEAIKKRIFQIWDYEGLDFPVPSIKERLGSIDSKTLKKWKKEYLEK